MPTNICGDVMMKYLSVIHPAELESMETVEFATLALLSLFGDTVYSRYLWMLNDSPILLMTLSPVVVSCEKVYSCFNYTILSIIKS